MYICVILKCLAMAVFVIFVLYTASFLYYLIGILDCLCALKITLGPVNACAFYMHCIKTILQHT